MLPHLPDGRRCTGCQTHPARAWRTIDHRTEPVCDECALRADLATAEASAARASVLAARLEMLLSDETLTDEQAAEVLGVDPEEVQGYVERHWMHRGSGRVPVVLEADLNRAVSLPGQAAALAGLDRDDVRTLLADQEGDRRLRDLLARRGDDERLRAHQVHAAADRLADARAGSASRAPRASTRRENRK